MRKEDHLKEIAGTKDPFKIPENYFADFKINLMSSLPAYPQKPEIAKVSAWHRIRPYVYLAAMFAGIWCMMKIFHNASSPLPSQNEAIAEVSNVGYVNITDDESYDYLATNSLDYSIELEEEISELYPSMEEFKTDFYSMPTD